MRRMSFLLLIACSEAPTTNNVAEPAAILVLETDYISGLVSGWTNHFSNRLNQTAVDGDSHLVELGLQFGVLQRGHGDNLVRLDPDLTVQNQWAFDPQSNPQDGLLVGDELWVSLYHEPYVLRLNAISGEPNSRLDISRFTDADGRPEAGDLLAAQSGLIYLVLQNLDFRGVEPIPPQTSWLLAFNTTGDLLHSIAIPANPYGAMIELEDGTILIACNRSWAIDPQAGLWRFDPQTNSGSFVVEEEALQGNILSFSANESAIFLVVAKADFTTDFRRINRVDNQLSLPFSGPSQNLGCVTTLSQGQTWVCDRQTETFGLRQVDEQQQQISEARISTRMAPLAIIENRHLEKF